MAFVDTSFAYLTLYAGLSSSAAEELQQQGKLKPEFFMNPSGTRAWIPLRTSPTSSLVRAHWGAEEREEVNLHPKEDFKVVEVTFTAHGLGYYYFQDILTTRDSNSWRFHGEIPQHAVSENGDVLVTIKEIHSVV